MAYEKYLHELDAAVGDYARVSAFLETEHWKLLVDVLNELARNSEREFIADEITAEQHRANLVAVKMIREPLEAIAKRGPEWVEQRERLLKMNERVRRRSAIPTLGLHGRGP